MSDIAVGAPYTREGARTAGAVWILRLHSDGTVKSSTKISVDDTTAFFGSSLV